MRRFGVTIFSEMTALALRTGSINLGQGAPDTDGPVELHDAAIAAIRAGRNQYAPGIGLPELRRAVAAHDERCYGLTYDPDTEVMITAGATEAVSACVLALCEPGDEVIVLEPTYDSYTAAIALAGAVLRPVRLDAPDADHAGYHLDLDALRAAVGPRTRLLLINSPHNPTAHILTADEAAAIAAVAIEHDLLVVTDEVYEHLVFDGASHVPLATLPGMRHRTLRVSSAGKTFSVTGWKVGWVCGDADLVSAVFTVKQFLTFTNGTPFQAGVAAGLGLPPERLSEVQGRLQSQRDILLPGLAAAGFDVHPSEATYFVTADAAALGASDALEFCRHLAQAVGVVGVPSSVFYDDPAGVQTLIRFAFCKQPDVLAEAVERLARL